MGLPFRSSSPVTSQRFFTPKRPDRLWSLSSRQYNRYGVQRPEREASNSRLSGAKVKNEWSYASAPVGRCGMERA